jgi:hypothetical protein
VEIPAAVAAPPEAPAVPAASVAVVAESAAKACAVKPGKRTMVKAKTLSTINAVFQLVISFIAPAPYSQQ